MLFAINKNGELNGQRSSEVRKISLIMIYGQRSSEVRKTSLKMIFEMK